MRVAECQHFSWLGIASAMPGLLLSGQASRPKLQACEAAPAASLCWLLGCLSLSATRAAQMILLSPTVLLV